MIDEVSQNQPPAVEQPAPTTETPQTTQADTPIGKPKKKPGKGLIIGLIALFLAVVGVSGYMVWERKQSVPESLSIDQVEPVVIKTETYEIRDSEVLTTLNVGFQVAIDKNWDVTVLESGKEHNLLLAKAEDESRIELEAFSHKMAKWEEHLESSLIIIKETESKNIGDYQVEIKKGVERLGQNEQSVIIGRWDAEEKSLVIRIFSNKSANAALFEQIAKSVNYGKAVSKNKLVGPVLAAENYVSSGLPEIDYQLIEVMAEPFIEEITKDCLSYKEGFVKGYRFLAFKSQRLATYGVETESYQGGSFIQTELFNSSGEKISGGGTHIEFKAPYTGEYFFLVYTFDQKEGKAEVRIDDHDQLGCRSFIRYPDGAELFNDSEDRDNVYKGAFEIAWGYQCPAPMEILDEHKVRYQHPMPRRDGETPRIVVSSATKAFTSSDPRYLIKEKDGQETRASIFIDNNYEDTSSIDVIIQQINTNRILVIPTEGLFPANNQIEISPWGIRLFTQNKPQAPNIPILENILQDYEEEFTSPEGQYDFTPISPVYIDWVMEDDASVELLAGTLYYRLSEKKTPAEYREVMKALLEEFKQYFLDKGYSLSEKNTHEGIPTSNAIPQPRDVVGLKNGSTACKLSSSTAKRFTIYCALLNE